MSTVTRVKQASKRKSTTKAAAMKVLGAAGLSFSMVNSASASTMPTFVPESDNTSPNHRFVLSEEEMSDVSLATFYVFDKENIGSGVLLARGGGCGHGCGGGGHGCGGGGHGCAVGGGGGHGCGGGGGCRGCGRGCGGRGCGGCGVGGFWFGGCGYGYGYDWGGACCASWGACRLC